MTIKLGPLVRKVVCISEQQPLEALFTLTECVGTVFVSVPNSTFWGSLFPWKCIFMCTMGVSGLDPGWVRVPVSLPIFLKIHSVRYLK